MPRSEAFARRVKKVGFAAVAVTLAFLLLEGLASTITVARIGWSRMGILAERAYSRYDAELGWVSLPNMSVPDMYGPGLSLVTNAQGFRNAAPVETAVPAGRVRVVCVGDSFTLGYGVATDQAWCNTLAAEDRRLDPVNMGQGGYGIDQAYLWYKRAGAPLDQNVLLFGFITVDFGRMRDSVFLGYNKPTLALEDGRLVERHVPVPYRSFLWAKTREAVRTLASFRLAQLIKSWLPSSAGSTAATPATSGGAADPLRPVVAAVFESLEHLAAAKHATLVLLYLPERDDYSGTGADDWRTFVRDTAARQGIDLIDLVPDLRQLPPGDIDGLFLKPGDVPYAHAEDHYTARGNAFVAHAVYAHLVSIPSVAAALAGTDR